MSNWLDREELKNIVNGWIYLAYTDRTEVHPWPMEKEQLPEPEMVLECRVFDADREARWVRTGIARDFRYRWCDDTVGNPDCYDEYQYLNRFDRKKLGMDQVIIRNYVAYGEESGQAYICDWRMAGFQREEE